MFHPSTNLRQIIQLASDPEADLRKLGRMVDLEPGLPDRVLRYVNGFYSRQAGKLSSASRAMAVAGPRVVLESATHHALITSITNAGMPPKLASIFWSTAIHRSMVARLLADAVRSNENADFAFTVGLAIEFGTGVLLCRESHLQLAWARDVRRLSGEARISAEQNLFGMDRTEAFMSVATDWGLNDELITIVGQYLNEQRKGQTRSNAVMFDIATWSNALGEALQSPAAGLSLIHI